MLEIGKVLKSNGTDGGLIMSFHAVSPEDIDLQEPVFIEFDGLPVPFYFESFSRRGTSKAVVSLTGVHSLKDADELSGLPVFADYFEEEDDEDLTGWTVKDASGTVIGTIADYEDIPGNTCIWVTRPSGGEVLLPLHEDLVIEADEKSGTLVLNVPDGILDL